MRELKKASSAWVREEMGVSKFGWQDGYSAFTVSPTAREAARKYIAGQEDHHRKHTFREELIDLLAKAGVDYDERYLD